MTAKFDVIMKIMIMIIMIVMLTVILRVGVCRGDLLGT